MTRAFRRHLPLLALAFSIVALASCAEKRAEETDLDGTYDGSIIKAGQTATMTMTNVQNGGTVTGTYSIGAPINESGTVTGSLLGLIYTFTLNRTAPTAGAFSGSVDVSNGTNKLVGSLASGLYTFDLTRQ